MFNLHIAHPTGPDKVQSGFAARSFGKTLGFVAGLVLIASIDALFWNSMLWRAVMGNLLPHDPSLHDAVARLVGLAPAR